MTFYLNAKLRRTAQRRWAAAASLETLYHRARAFYQTRRYGRQVIHLPDPVSMPALVDGRSALEQDVITQSFDDNFYLTTNPDVAAARADPLDHFLTYGWREGRQPHPEFDTAYYLAANPDVAAAGINPFYHYIVAGRAEGRAGCPPAPVESLDDLERNVIAPRFDSEFYLAANPDVAAARIDPLDHFLTYGWREGRQPHPEFDTAYYLAANPDVAAAGINPFYHYIVAGRAEGRAARHPNSVMRVMLDRARPLREKAKEWPGPTALDTLTPDALNRAIEHIIPMHRRHVVLSLSHDEYRQATGGVQNCLGDEQRVFNGAEWTYLHLCPAVPLPMMSDETDPGRFVFTITIDGKRVGHGWAKDLIRILAERRERTGFTPYLVIHHMLGHSPEIVVALSEALGNCDTTFWVHDFFSICPNYALLRNDIKFCHAPPVESAACGVCVYGQERKKHVARLARLFATRPRIIAPSRPTRDLWCASSRYAYNSLTVLPHASFVPEASRQRKVTRGQLLTIAFIGGAAPHKGWDVFVDLARRNAGGGEYRFLHLGTPDTGVAQIAHVEVLVSPDDRTAMVRTIKEQDVDVVVNWSLCYETFSFTTLEAIAAGTFIVARSDSGNIAALLNASSQGCLLENEEELFDLFATCQLRTLVEDTYASGIPVGTIRSHGITADILLKS